MLVYTRRGFEPKPGGIRIINFCVTTRLQSKIKPLYLIHYARYLTSNTTRVVQHFYTDWYKVFLHSRTGTITGTYCSLWEVIIQNLFVWGFFKFVWWRVRERYFDHRDHCSEPTLRSDMDPSMPERLLRP